MSPRSFGAEASPDTQASTTCTCSRQEANSLHSFVSKLLRCLDRRALRSQKQVRNDMQHQEKAISGSHFLRKETLLFLSFLNSQMWKSMENTGNVIHC